MQYSVSIGGSTRCLVLRDNAWLLRHAKSEDVGQTVTGHMRHRSSEELKAPDRPPGPNTACHGIMLKDGIG